MIGPRRLGACLLFIFAVLLALPPTVHGQEAQTPRDVVILLDTSASMVGKGDDPKAQDIWSKVTGAVVDLVEVQTPDTRVAIMPFDQGVHQDRAHVFAARPARADLEAYLGGITPDGQLTWIYESVLTGLDQLQVWRKDEPKRPQALYVFTDGLDNGPHSASWVADLSKQITLQRADNPYLYAYYNDLQTQLDAAQRQALSAGGFSVVQGFTEVNVPVLDFGTFAPGENKRTEPLPFFFTSDVAPGTIALKLDGGGLPLHIEPTQTQIGTKSPMVAVTLYLDGDIAAGPHQATLQLDATDGLNLQGAHDLPVRFQIQARPPPPPAPTATATPSPTATSTPVPTSTPIPTATPVPTPTAPPAPPDIVLNSSPPGATFPLDTGGLHVGWPITISRANDLMLTVALAEHGDPAQRPQPYTSWFDASHPPTFRLMVIPSPTDPKGCAATHWCNGIVLTPAPGTTTVVQHLQPLRLIGNGQQLQLRVVGDGQLADGRVWHEESPVRTIEGHQPEWASVWNGAGIGYWIWPLVAIGLLALFSWVDTRTRPPF